LYVERLSITNFRCFERATLELNYPGRGDTATHQTPQRLQNVNLFLGGNGSGKSSVFKALALGILAPVISSSGFQSDYLVRRTPRESGAGQNGNGHSSSQPIPKISATVEASLVLDATDTETPHTVVSNVEIRRFGDVEDIAVLTPYMQEDVWKQMYLNDSPAFFLAGYGANRRTERPEGYSEKNRNMRYQRVASIFEDHVGLVPFTQGYWNLQSLGCLEEAASLLNGLLPAGVTLTTQDSQNPQFHKDGILLPFSALSDGFRTFIGWVWDLLLHLARVRGSNSSMSLAGISGVVIVDEIDLFLHPEWQRLVVEQIASTFPRIQFFFSTHSPLVAGTLETENIFVMEPEGIEQYEENIHGLTANQVLTSSYFGLSSTRAPGTEMSEISKLAISGNDADRKEFAKRMAEAIPVE
jgi:energy-coupling factor transporter ATP-binding protein EcfA2